jgi:hypothetical protein
MYNISLISRVLVIEFLLGVKVFYHQNMIVIIIEAVV